MVSDIVSQEKIGPCSQADENSLQEMRKAQRAQGVSVQDRQGFSPQTGKEKI